MERLTKRIYCETYVKRYKNSKRKVTQRHVERLKAALKVMYLIDWKN